MIHNIKGYFILQGIVILTFVLALIVLAYGCSSINDIVNYQMLYENQIVLNKTLSIQNDSLLQMIPVENTNYKKEYLILLHKIDSLKNVVANADSIRDGETIIVLQSIEDSLENLSDQSLNYLIELRNK